MRKPNRTLPCRGRYGRAGRRFSRTRPAQQQHSLRPATTMAAALVLAVILATATAQAASGSYTVRSGDSLWKIATANGMTVAELKSINNLTSDIIYPGQTLSLSHSTRYTVQKNDSLWLIARRYGVTVSALQSANGLSGSLIYPGQTLTIPAAAKAAASALAPSPGQKLSLSHSTRYTVQKNDSLWLIARRYGVTVSALQSANGLTGSLIYPGQTLVIPAATKAEASALAPSTASWPSVTYIVRAGDTVSGIAARFGVSAAQIVKYNYMEPDEWLNEGQMIAINGYAPRNWAVTPGESSAPARKGKLVDWFLDGQYLLNRNDVMRITDVATGLAFTVKMLGGVNHCDVEPLTSSDTAVMKKLFPTWTWNPRPVVIFHDGINFAASLSGMPHSFDTITNGVAGHFDLYLYNSKGHGSTSEEYLAQHRNCVLVAAGLK
ncbi:MAG: LysM peptidoglycan-binding domain-containing protein [Christensenellales bacterium]|jgi:D-gamma-glutamyl-meso-diaminopimelic acid endopeptidase CwlS